MKFLAAFCASTLLVATPAIAQDSETAIAQLSNMQLAQEIVDQGFPEEDRLSIFTGFVAELSNQIRNSIPEASSDPELLAALDAHITRVLAASKDVLSLHMDDLMASLVIAYAESFTREELEGLHAFVTSPAGQGFLARSTAIMSHPAFAEANQRYIADYLPRAQELNAEFQREITRIMADRLGETTK